MSVWGTVCIRSTLRGFSWKHGINDFEVRLDNFVITPRSCRVPGFPETPTYTLKPGQPTPGSSSLLRHPITTHTGAGMLTSYPSTTPLGLALGTDSPCADERCTGTLSHSARRIFTPLIVTHVSILTSDTSSIPHGTPSTAYRTLLYHPQRTEDPKLRCMV